jgi:hypothetical protein
MKTESLSLSRRMIVVKQAISKRNNNVTLLIDTEEPPRGVLIYGTAKPETEFELEPTAISICEKYMSKEKAQTQWSSVCPPTTKWLKIIVTPEHMPSFTF